MRYFLSLLVVVFVEAQIRINHFNAGPSATVLHQANASLVIVGTKNGNLISYTPKGQLLNEQQEPHRVAITSIESIQIDNSSYMLVSDKQGFVSMWKDGILKQILNKQREITQIVTSKFNQASVLAINMKQSIDIHELPSLKLIKTISNQGFTFRKVLPAQKNELCILVQSQQRSSIWIYSISDKFQPIIKRQNTIVDFAISVSQHSYYLFLIDTSKNIEIYVLDSNYKVKDEFNSITNKFIASSYSSVVYLRNNKELPLFVASKTPQQIQFFNGFDITLFLQLNAEIKSIHSTLNQSLILLSNNGQVTSITLGEPTDESSYWILFFILLLLAVGLYLFCGDCCPGVIQKWKMQQQRKEIELQLYRQRTDLQNF